MEVERIRKVHRFFENSAFISNQEEPAADDIALYERLNRFAQDAHVESPNIIFPHENLAGCWWFYFSGAGSGEPVLAKENGRGGYSLLRSVSEDAAAGALERVAASSDSTFFPRSEVVEVGEGIYVATDFVVSVEHPTRGLDVSNFYSDCLRIGFNADTNATNFVLTDGVNSSTWIRIFASG